MRKAQPLVSYSIEEYAALARASDRRFEYRDGEIVAMSGGTLAHYLIGGSLFRAISSKLPAHCRAFTSSAAVKSPVDPTYRYSDGFIVCGEVITEQVLGIDAIANPVVIFEVLSPESADYDRDERRKIYQAIPTLGEYLLVAQDSAHIVRYVKQGDFWQRDEVAGLDEQLELSTVKVTVSFADVYQGVKFE